MLLLPKKYHKLIIEWQGPYKVIDKVSDVDYRIDVNGKEKISHVNMIAKYHTHRRDNVIFIHNFQDDNTKR